MPGLRLRKSSVNINNLQDKNQNRNQNQNWSQDRLVFHMLNGIQEGHPCGANVLNVKKWDITVKRSQINTEVMKYTGCILTLKIMCGRYARLKLKLKDSKSKSK